MTELIVIGAGDYGREVMQWAIDCNEKQPKWKIKGFLDPNPHALRNTTCTLPVLGSDTDWEVNEKQEFVLAISDPQKKEQIVTSFLKRRAQFATIIHPTAFVAHGATIGRGSIIYPQACISIDARIGSFCTIQTTGLGHDVCIEDYCTISSYCNLMGHVSVGKRVFIGSHCAVIPGISIGDDAYLGVGSVVIRNVHAGIRVYGNPARKISL